MCRHSQPWAHARRRGARCLARPPFWPCNKVLKSNFRSMISQTNNGCSLLSLILAKLLLLDISRVGIPGYPDPEIRGFSPIITNSEPEIGNIRGRIFRGGIPGLQHCATAIMLGLISLTLFKTVFNRPVGVVVTISL